MLPGVKPAAGGDQVASLPECRPKMSNFTQDKARKMWYYENVVAGRTGALSKQEISYAR